MYWAVTPLNVPFIPKFLKYHGQILFCSRLLMYPKKFASSCQRSSIGLRSRDLGGTFWPPVDVANVSRIIRTRQLVCFGSLSCLKRSLSGKVPWMDATALLLNCVLPVRTIFQKLSPGEWTWTFGRTLCHCPICLQSLLYICSLFPKSHSPIDKLLFGSWLYNVHFSSSQSISIGFRSWDSGVIIQQLMLLPSMKLQARLLICLGSLSCLNYKKTVWEGFWNGWKLSVARNLEPCVYDAFSTIGPFFEMLSKLCLNGMLWFAFTSANPTFDKSWACDVLQYKRTFVRKNHIIKLLIIFFSQAPLAELKLFDSITLSN